MSAADGENSKIVRERRSAPTTLADDDNPDRRITRSRRNVDYKINQQLPSGPPRPKFPLFWFCLCLIIDIADIFLTAAVVTGVIPIIWAIVKILFSLAEIWYINRRNRSMASYRLETATRRVALRQLEKRIITKWGTVLAEWIPGVNILPMNTILLLLTHFDNVKFVQAINAGLSAGKSTISITETQA